jgi:hypothetical protein
MRDREGSGGGEGLIDVAGKRSRRRDAGQGGGQNWKPEEVVALHHFSELINSMAQTEPFMAGVGAVFFARDRDAVYAALRDYPELLTDRGNAAFELAAGWMELVSPGRLTDMVKRAGADVQAIREART